MWLYGCNNSWTSTPGRPGSSCRDYPVPMEAALLANPARLVIFIVVVIVALVVIDLVRRMRENGD